MTQLASEKVNTLKLRDVSIRCITNDFDEGVSFNPSEFAAGRGWLNECELEMFFLNILALVQ